MTQTAIRFLAQNKYLLVDVVDAVEDSKEETPSIVLPEGYKKQESHYKLGVILDAEDGGEYHKHIGSYILFPANALQEIAVHGLNVKVVPSHAVFGVLKNVEVNPQE